MEQVTVSDKYQVVIPRRLRERLKIKKRQKMNAIRSGNAIVLLPDVSIEEMRGAFPGLSSEGIREETDRF